MNPPNDIQDALASALALCQASGGLNAQQESCLRTLLDAVPDAAIRNRLDELASSRGGAGPVPSSQPFQPGESTKKRAQVEDEDDSPSSATLAPSTPKKIRRNTGADASPRTTPRRTPKTPRTQGLFHAPDTPLSATPTTHRAGLDSSPSGGLLAAAFGDVDVFSAYDSTSFTPALSLSAAHAKEEARAAAAQCKIRRTLTTFRRYWAGHRDQLPTRLDFTPSGQLLGTHENRLFFVLQERLTADIALLRRVHVGVSAETLAMQTAAVGEVEAALHRCHDVEAQLTAAAAPATAAAAPATAAPAAAAAAPAAAAAAPAAAAAAAAPAAAAAGDDNDDERTAVPSRPSTPRRSATLVPPDLPGLGGPPPGGVAPPGSPCNRNSTSARREKRSVVDELASTAPDPDTVPKRKKARNIKEPHRLAAGPRPLQKETVKLLCALSGVISPGAYHEVASVIRRGVLPNQLLNAELGRDSLRDDDLPSLVHHARQCHEADTHGWLLSLYSMLVEFRFALTLQRIMAGGSWEGSPSEYLQEHRASFPAPLDRLMEWHGKGLRWAFMMNAGSVPLLLGAAVLNMRRALSRTSWDVLREFCTCIRDPAKKNVLYVQNFIVPTLVEWGKCFNVRLGTRIFGRDLKEDDKILEQLEFNTLRLPARGIHWADWKADNQLTVFESLPPALQPTLEHRLPQTWIPPSRPCTTVVFKKMSMKTRLGMAKTPDFDPPRRKKPKKEYTKAEKKARSQAARVRRNKWADEERAAAREGQLIPDTLADLQDMADVHTFEEEGPYVRLESKLARKNQTDVKCLDSDGTLMVDVLDTSCFEERESDALYDYLIDATGVDRRGIATSSAGPLRPFQALHLVVTNRYSELGDDAAAAQTSEDADDLEGNAHQRVPRPHLDIRRDIQGYNDVCAVLQKIFRLVAERIKERYPKTYKVLMDYVEVLPLGAWSPCYPLAGFVLNFGGMTQPHFDQDLGVCIVVTFGRFEGGELALYEGKILLDLDGFSICIFPSDFFTHFNLPFKGERMSMAMATEKVSKRWTYDRNLWRSHTSAKTMPAQ
ncbi:hypothetical protein EXIGLDRAFT_776269 [Exidia glandulosa HHB12029]|uniref:Uncharacterized protein n=1 Tax=Exidia glandulosa HHB12029 TaxID=1314781 RepID=A0A165DJF1_EXIGL|nr:hypothetical protein EXIGLDRAFT_776269 [Exidia glandulosa HHB12029]